MKKIIIRGLILGIVWSIASALINYIKNPQVEAYVREITFLTIGIVYANFTLK